ncbi:MAG: organic hydroperoxide resistance protein [Chitinophagaceae bacterium]|nr:organic hydroperoxide resistance protein [Oligoflexus sp.]
MITLEKVLYTAKAHTTGGREGQATSDDGRLKVTLSTPKGLGGNDGPGTNPEQLFAAGYAACFIGALKHTSMAQKIKLPDGLAVDCSVQIGPAGQAFGISASLLVHLPGMEESAATSLVAKAHEVCPYSNATRGNINVDVKVLV